MPLPSHWTREDLDKLAHFDAQQYYEWLRNGVKLSEDFGKTWKAFAPVAYRFDLEHDIDEHIVYMFSAMNESEQLVFLEAIRLGFTNAEETEDGYAFFGFLQLLVMLLKKDEVLESMVARVCRTTFLDNAREVLAQHVYATCFLVIGAILPKNTADLFADLMESRFYREGYRLEIDKILAKVA